MQKPLTRKSKIALPDVGCLHVALEDEVLDFVLLLLRIVPTKTQRTREASIIRT